MVTMKSGCFAESGSEEVSPPISLFLKYFACLQYVVSGSDDFRIYWWKLPKCVSGMYNLDGLMQYFIPSLSLPLEPREEIIPHLVMPGHRSIVNQTRYSNANHLLCSSGVEKIFKVHP